MNNRLDCIIAIPTFVDKNRKHTFSNLEMLGPEYIIASVLYHGFSGKMYNAYSNDVTEDEILDAIDLYDPAVLGITCASQRSYPAVVAFIERLKALEWHGTIVVGGFYATLEPERILRDNPEIDYISLGEGEYTFPAIVSAVIHNQDMSALEGVAYRVGDEIVLKPQERIRNLDFPFFPYRYPITKNAVSNMIDGKYIPGKYYNMSAGRGCYGRCSFCSISESEGARIRIYRSPKNVVDEMEYLKNNFDANHIWFNDEIFYERSVRGRKWMKDFCAELKKRNLNMTFNIELRPNDIHEEELMMLRDVGLRAIFIGIESGIQRILDEMRKDTTVEINVKALEVLKRLDIKIEMGWISLVPTMTFQELKNNYEFLFSTGCYTEENIYNRFNLYPGCYYEVILNKMHLLNPESVFYDRFGYDFYDPKVRLFTELIDGLRGEFIQIKEKTFIVQERTSISGDYSEYLHIRQLQRELWTSLIPRLIETVEFGNIHDYSGLKATNMYVWFQEQLSMILQSINA